MAHASSAAHAESATKRFGSGWAWLVLQDGKLIITSTPITSSSEYRIASLVND